MLAEFFIAPQTPSQTADLIVQCLGLAILTICGAVMLSQRRFAAFFQLPAQPQHQLEPTDILLGLLAFFWIPSAAMAVLARTGVVTSMPASAPEGWAPAATQVWVGLLGRSLGILLLIAVGVRRFVDGRRGWGLRFDRLPTDIGVATVSYLAFWPVCAGAVYVTVGIMELLQPGVTFRDHPSIELLRGRDTTQAAALLTMVDAGLAAPLIEELFFRGLLQPALARWWRSPWAAILFCGTAFGAIHYTNVETVPALALFGVVLGFVYARTRSLTATIALHMLFNIKTLVWLWLDRASGVSP